MRYNGFIYIVLILILTAGISRAQLPYRSLLFKTYSQRAPLLLGFYYGVLPDKGKDSATIFRTIDSIAQMAKEEKDKDLLLETRLMRVHYFYYRDESFPRAMVLNKLDSLKQSAVHENVLWLEIMAENMLALYNYNTANYEQAFVHHRRVYNLIKDLSPADFPHKQNCLMQMGMEHYRFNDFPESVFYIRQALEASPPAKMTMVDPRLSLLNTLGLAYQKMEKLDSAGMYFSQTIREAGKEGNIAWECIASGNLGYNYFLEGDYASAIPLLQKDVDNAIKDHDWGLASGSQMVLGDISLRQNQVAEAWDQLQLARRYAYDSKQYNRLQTLYPLLAKLYAFKGQPAASAIYLDSALQVKDSLSRSFNGLLLLRARQQVEMEQYNAEMENIRSRRKINIMERNILMGAILVLMAVAVLIYKEQRRKRREQLEKAMRANEELAAATRQLNDFARNISEKNALIEILEGQKDVVAADALAQLRHSTILTDDDWNYFRSVFEKVYAGFMDRLKEKAPALTPAETRFIVLTRLGLSGKEMAAMLGVGADAIRQLRSRVRKKLDLGDENGLEGWVALI